MFMEAAVEAQGFSGMPIEKAPIDMSVEEFVRWRKDEIEQIENKKKNIRRMRREMDLEREELVMMRESNDRWHEMEVARQQNEERLLDMKRQILEKELYKLAEEKRLFNQKRKFYEQVDTYQRTSQIQRKKQAIVRGEMFFVGVTNVSSLRKRYKDLLKIYHPDNKYGDTDTIQEINREYQRLSEKIEV